jgi:hypothetical protein
MRLPQIILTALAVAATAAPAFAQATLSLPAPSPGASVTQTVGTTDLSLKYSRPGVKGRAVWGALVPYGEPWRTGANEATTLTVADDVQVEGKPLPAGSYAIVTVPGKDEWTVAFSKQKNLWRGTAYDAKEDQLRVTVKPQAAEHVEWLQFTFDATSPSETELALRWEKLRVPVRISVDVTAKVLRDCRAAVAAAAADDWRTPYRAATWCLENGQAPDETAAWSAKALGLKENFQTLSLAARLAAKAGRTQEAVAQMTKAVELGKADKGLVPAQIEPMEKLLAEWSSKK